MTTTGIGHLTKSTTMYPSRLGSLARVFSVIMMAIISPMDPIEKMKWKLQ
jgi:hypothetical protein